jgi:hypothetical protein
VRAARANEIFKLGLNQDAWRDLDAVIGLEHHGVRLHAACPPAIGRLKALCSRSVRVSRSLTS